LEVSARALAGSAICIVLASSLLVLSEPTLELAVFSEVPFEAIEQEVWGIGPTSRTSMVIQDEATWEILWFEIHTGSTPMPELPFVNFTTEMLIVAAQGVRSSGGYSTNITRVKLMGGFYVVYVDEIHPGPDCVTITAMTYPYHIVKVNGFPLSLPVQFAYNVTERIC
jgi:hypothetical protein